jgi:SAM-dependent methyltransferase
MTEQDASAYGEGFAAVYASPRYAVFSQRLARLSLQILDEVGTPGRQLLDLACGAGAGSVLFAKAGYQVTGIDRSEVMLRHAREHAAKRGVTLTLSVDDMRSFKTAHRFDVITCLFDALNYITEEQDLACVFQSAAAALNVRGVFIFDLNTSAGLSTRWGTRDRVFTNRADVFEVNQSNFDESTATNTTVTTVFVRQPDSDLFRRYMEVHRERAYSTATITRLLEQSGFLIERIYGLPDSVEGIPQKLEPALEDTGRVIIAARTSADATSAAITP